jgi:predicted ATPase
LGSSLFYRGELVSARIYLEEGMVLYDAYEHSDLALQYGQDSGVACRSYASWVLWLLGYPDQALKLSSEAVAFAEELGHPFSLALALSFSAWFHQFCQQPQLTYERAESARALSVDMGFQFWLGWEMVMQGWAMGGQDSEKKKISMVRQGIETWRATGSELGRPYFLALFADVCSRAGQVEKGLKLISEALNLVSNTKERWYEAELYRLKGEMLFTSCTKNIDEVETCFFNALKIAQHQKAKSLELRAAICLARLWHHDGKAEQARQLLGETYDWFTEGFDTPDLQEAKKLLEELDIFLMEPIK